MTAATSSETPSVNGEQNMTEKRAAARRAYRASLASERPITGAELGRRFGQSARWGRDRVAEVKAGTHSDDEMAEGRDVSPQDREGPDGSQDAQGTSTVAASGPAVRSDAGPAAGMWRAEAASPTVQPTDHTHHDGTAPIDDVPAVTAAVRRISTLAVLAVALVAAVASYDHQRVLAEMAGEG